MAQPPLFKVWLKRTRGRMQLVISFKLIVFKHTGVLSTPLNCVYAESEGPGEDQRVEGPSAEGDDGERSTAEFQVLPAARHAGVSSEDG
eukprot:2262674-Pleurochrysis_carterae.AAC.1